MPTNDLAKLLEDDTDAFLAAVDAEDSPAPEAPSPRAAAPSDEDAPAESQPTGQPRNERGQFAPKAPDAAATEPASALPAAPDAGTAQPTAVVPETPAAPVAVEPFTVRAGGQVHTLDFVQPGPDGSLVVKPEHVAHFRQLASEAVYNRTQGRQERLTAQQTIRELRQQLEKPNPLHQQSQQLLEMLATRPIDGTLIDTLAQFQADYPRLQAEWARAEADELRKALQEGRMPAHLTPEPQPYVATAQDVAAEAEEAWTEVAVHVPGAATLTADERAAIIALASEMPDAFVKAATAEDAAQYGLEVGQPAFDTPRFAKLVAREVERVQKHKQAIAAMQAAAAKNAQQTATVTAPVGAPSRSATVAPKAAPKITSKQEWERSLADLAKD